MSTRMIVKGDTVLKGIYTEDTILEIEGDGGIVVVEPGDLQMCLGGRSESSRLRVVVLNNVQLVCRPANGASATIGLWGQNMMPYVVLKSGASIWCPELTGHRKMTIENGIVVYQIGVEGPMLHLIYEDTPSIFEGKIQISLTGFERELRDCDSLADLVTQAEGVVLEKILAQCRTKGFTELEDEFSLETVTLLAMWYCPELRHRLKEQKIDSLVALFDAVIDIYSGSWLEEKERSVVRQSYVLEANATSNFQNSGKNSSNLFKLQISQTGEIFVTASNEDTLKRWRIQSELGNVSQTLALIGILTPMPIKVLEEFRSVLLRAKLQLKIMNY